MAWRNWLFGRSRCRLENRWADGNYDRVPALARDLVTRQPALIVTGGATPNAIAAKAATGSIPIVFVLGSYPWKLVL